MNILIYAGITAGGLATLFFILGSKENVKKIKKKRWINKENIIGVIFSVVATFLITYGSVISSEEDKEEIINTLQESIPFNKYNEINNKSFEGYSVNFVMNIRTVDEKKRKYIIDICKDSIKNRISLYLDNNNNLVYRLIDDESEEHIIKIPRKIYSFQLNVWYFIYFDYGYSNDFSFMRLYINDKLVGDKFFKYNLNIPKTLEAKDMFIATDINRQNFSKIELKSVMMIRKTLPERNIIQMMKFIADY